MDTKVLKKPSFFFCCFFAMFVRRHKQCSACRTPYLERSSYLGLSFSAHLQSQGPCSLHLGYSEFLDWGCNCCHGGLLFIASITDQGMYRKEKGSSKMRVFHLVQWKMWTRYSFIFCWDSNCTPKLLVQCLMHAAALERVSLSCVFPSPALQHGFIVIPHIAPFVCDDSNGLLWLDGPCTCGPQG